MSNIAAFTKCLLQTHIIFSVNEQTVIAQSDLPSIQNKRGVSFSGAWTRYGFHEDGFTSGLNRAEELGAKAPFRVEKAGREVLAVPGWIKSGVQTAEGVRRVLVGFIWGNAAQKDKKA